MKKYIILFFMVLAASVADAQLFTSNNKPVLTSGQLAEQPVATFSGNHNSLLDRHITVSSAAERKNPYTTGATAKPVYNWKSSRSTASMGMIQTNTLSATTISGKSFSDGLIYNGGDADLDTGADDLIPGELRAPMGDLPILFAMLLMLAYSLFCLRRRKA